MLDEVDKALDMSRKAVTLIERMELWELGDRAYLILGQALMENGEAARSKDVLEQGMALLDEDGLSLTQFQLLAALGALSCSQSAAIQPRLQGMVDRIREGTEKWGFKSSLLAELNRICVAADLSLRIPEQGQIYAMVRGAEMDDRVRILWTVDAGHSDALIKERKGKVALRRQRIQRLLDEAEQQSADPTQEELATALGVSVRTIRSDLGALEDE